MMAMGKFTAKVVETGVDPYTAAEMTRFWAQN